MNPGAVREEARIFGATSVDARGTLNARRDAHLQAGFALQASGPERKGVASPSVFDPESTAKLLALARKGEPHALDTLFARYLPPLLKWTSGRLPRWARDMADTSDLVQDTLLHTFKQIEAFEPRTEGALHAYLRQAVKNRIRDEIRKRQRRGAKEGVDSDILDREPSPLEQAIGHQAMDRYESALGRLRVEDRDMLIGRIELGLTYDELAAASGKPSADAARKAARRALVKLVEEMKHVG